MLADATAAELKRLRGLLSTLPPGDRGPLACLAGILLLTEAVQDYQLALETTDDTEVCSRANACRLSRSLAGHTPQGSQHSADQVDH